MKQLHEYDTPETDASEEMCREHIGGVNLVYVDDMADLERRLAACRDALELVTNWSTENTILDLSKKTLALTQKP